MTTTSDTQTAPRSHRAVRLLTLCAGLLSTVALTVPAQVPVLGVQAGSACQSAGSSCGG